MPDSLATARLLEARVATFHAQAADLARKSEELLALTRAHIIALQTAAYEATAKIA